MTDVQPNPEREQDPETNTPSRMKIRNSANTCASRPSASRARKIRRPRLAERELPAQAARMALVREAEESRYDRYPTHCGCAG